MKIMARGSDNVRELLVLSQEQNITLVKIEGEDLHPQRMIVGYNDEIIDLKTSKVEGGSS